MNIAQLEAAFSKDPDPSSTVLRGLARASGIGILEVEQWFKERRDALEAQDPSVDDQKVQDQKQNGHVLVPILEVVNPEIKNPRVPGPSEANQGVKRNPEASNHQDQDHSDPKPSILEVNEECFQKAHDPNVPGPSEANQRVKRIREASNHQDHNEPPAKRPAALNPTIREINQQIDLYLHSPKHRDCFLGIFKTMGPGITEEEIDGVGLVIGVAPSIIRHWKQVLEGRGLLPIPPPKIDRSQNVPEARKVKRLAVVDPAIQKIIEKLDLYNLKSHDFFLGIIKIIGPQESEAETGQIVGVNPSIIRHWKQVLESQGLIRISPPKIDRSQVAPPPSPRPRSPPPRKADPTILLDPAETYPYLASARLLIELYAEEGVPPHMEFAINFLRRHVAAVEALQRVEPPKPTTPVKLTRQEAAERFRKMAEEFRDKRNVKQEEADSQ